MSADTDRGVTGEELPIPEIQALLLCDREIYDPRTGTRSLFGIFTRIDVESFPTGFELDFYARLTNADGPYTFRLEFVQALGDVPLGGGDFGPFNMNDTVRVHEFTARVAVALPGPGHYEFRFYGNGIYLGRTAFDALTADSKG